ncbi:putative serine esterase-domain-containing protein [Xylariales sp. PMI_506]|nr:putative serine esterase-domain-containing protein [Xylariales sp. PMI_506]
MVQRGPAVFDPFLSLLRPQYRDSKLKTGQLAPQLLTARFAGPTSAKVSELWCKFRRMLRGNAARLLGRRAQPRQVLCLEHVSQRRLSMTGIKPLVPLQPQQRALFIRRKATMEYSDGSPEADHLCVLVHGLWGNPDHMKSIAKTLRAEYPGDKLYLLLTQRNTGNFTYDGIERCGERVCLEIEEQLEIIKSKGGNITKLSIVGYSLGGLVARYAIGILGARGVLDKVKPMTFTTFASPHLGVRAPLLGWHNHVWNVVGARTLSMSGRQLFLVDEFRDTGRPLLAVLADPGSIFMSSLAKFERRTLYANIINDKIAVYYTTGIAKTDPFSDTSKIKANYVEGYGDVVLDPKNPFSPQKPKQPESTYVSMKEASLGYVRNAPLAMFLAVFVPIGVVVFLVNSVIQNFLSSRRIDMYERGLEGIQLKNYRIPIMIKELREAVEGAYENLNSSHQQQYLASSDEDREDVDLNDDERETMALERQQSHPDWPTLALAPSQFEMIKALDQLGWRKYPVWIHKVRRSHAAMIIRTENSAYEEGKIVLRHWVKEEFMI